MSFAPSRSSQRRGLTRAAALVGITALAAGSAFLLSTAAQAEDPVGQVDLSVSVPAWDGGNGPVVGLPLDGGYKDLRVDVRNDVAADTAATGVTLHFTLPAPNDNGSVTLAEGFADKCTLDGLTGTCALGDLAPGSIANLRAFTVHSTVGADDKIRRIGKVAVSVSAEQEDREESDNSFALVARAMKKPGFDLAVWVRENDLVVRPGETGVLDAEDFRIENDSASPAQGIEYYVNLPQHLAFTSAPAGCEIQDGEKRWIICETKETIPAHGKLATPALEYTVAAGAPPRARLKGTAQVSAIAKRIGKPADPVDPPSVLVLSDPSVSDAQAKKYVENNQSGQDNVAEFAVFTYADQADLAVTLSVPDAKVGAESKVVATITNNGPWAVENGAELVIKAPSGTTNLHSADECTADGSTLVCRLDGELASGASREYTFTLRVDSKEIGDDGSVEVRSGQPDPVSANNVAALKPKVLADGPSGTPSTSPTGPGGMPVTGTSLTLMGVAAAALVAAGGAFMIVARRRRAATASADEE
ncbi:DUF11 domain-containing protein [Phytomonospora endophytica]|uniref:DUF11 domain-containing protein n=1 Tax=Phytomonospora endophytica TaxID=714109 RepID=A0A841FE28_9ACTN|nr:DUF11 domain-containing protein [Phytomonospora endophytica]MBB6035521.1 hypothetical protein [Phytomonospora endophytica]GIG63728.1 hypothetical protein Pen01_00230 [Phytomonospora endophytica]